MYNNVYDFIKTEESIFKTLKVPVAENWDWNMSEHIRNGVIYKYGQYLSGKTDDKPNKNIILPILRLRYRTEGFDIKDIELFVNDVKNYWKSFLVKKFHEYFAQQNDLDSFIDEGCETDIDFGGVLVKDTGEIKPEVVPWQRIAFCDQTDILSGPICERHQFSSDQLLAMKGKGWQNIERVIVLSKSNKVVDKQTGQAIQTPGKYIEVYELHGNLPYSWLTNGDTYDEEEEYVNQIHICTFYQDEKGNKHGITLFSGKEKGLPYKLKTEKIYNRALGYGGVEELIEPQVWTNYGIIREKGLLDQVSKIIYQTADVAFANRNKTNDIENGEILVYEDGKPITEVNTQAPNMVLFERSIANWEAHARQMGAATESIMGEQPSAGTPFKLQELITQTSLGLHTYRMGKYAKFIEEIYREWIIPKIVDKLLQGQTWLSELSTNEMKDIMDKIVEKKAEDMVKESILNGELPTKDSIEVFKQQIRDNFLKGGNKKFIEIFKDEFKKTSISICINIKGKQKDLVNTVDKLVNIWRMIMANPQGFLTMMQNPALAKNFSEIIEYSGLSPIDFASLTSTIPAPLVPQDTAPLQNLNQGQPQPIIQQ